MNRDRYRRTTAPLVVETTGKTVDEAIQAALSRLRARRDEVEIKVIQEGRGGFLGLGSREARVRVEKRQGGVRREVRAERGPQRGPDGGGRSYGRPVSRRAPEDLERLEEEIRARRDQRRAGGSPRSGEDRIARVVPGQGRSRDGQAEGMRGPGGGRGGRDRRRDAPRSRGGEVRPTRSSTAGAEGEERPRAAEPPSAAVAGLQKAPEGQPDPRRLAEFTQELLRKMGFVASVDARYADDAYEVRVEAGENDALLIGRKGETLDALQHLLAKMVSRGQVELLRVRVDVSEYRQRRTSELAERALAMAQQVRDTGQEVVTEPLAAAERRVIHRTLADQPGVTTQALGDGLVKRVWIGPDGQVPDLEREAPLQDRSHEAETMSRHPAPATAEAPRSLIDPWDSAPAKATPAGDGSVAEWGRRPKPARGRRR